VTGAVSGPREPDALSRVRGVQAARADGADVEALALGTRLTRSSPHLATADPDRGLAAATAYLAGCHQVSKRGLEKIVATLFEVPVALGTLANLEQERSQALAPAHAEAVQAVQQAPAKHADETGWKKHGKKCWLWVAATAQVAAFVLHAGRGLAGLAVLLGATISGIVISDRWCAYRHLPVYRRQLCWAHLARDFQGLIDLRDYVASQTARISADPLYPPRLYVPQRFRELGRPGRGVRDDLADELLSQVAADHGLTAQVNLSGPSYKVVAQVNQSDLAFLRELRLGLDSIDLVSLIVQVENRLHIKVETDELKKVSRVGELLDLLVRQGIQVACAGITLPNDASVGLHESLGFERVGIYRRIGWKAGAWRDVGWWQAELQPPGEGPPLEPGQPLSLTS